MLSVSSHWDQLRAVFSVRRNRLYVQTGIRTPRRTIRSEHSARTDAQTILVQR